jgi:hypothetical protein
MQIFIFHGSLLLNKNPRFFHLVYSTPPRANYVKPKQINGKKEKEGLIKKVERKWQEEVKEGMDVKAGKVEDPSSWKKFKGTILTVSLIDHILSQVSQV